jgi:tyrosine-protein kinase Etk/Wzc
MPPPVRHPNRRPGPSTTIQAGGGGGRAERVTAPRTKVLHCRLMNFLDQCLALMRWKKLILLHTVGFAVASVVVALLLPKWYRSTTSIFPPEDDVLSAGSLSSLASVAAIASGRTSLPIWATPSDVYAAVLRSRSVREEVVRRHDLIRVYKVKDMDHALKVLANRINVKVGGEGLVQVKVLDKNAQRAADMANSCVNVLDRINREKRHTAARQARSFIEDRLADNRIDLKAAEESLRATQVTTKVLMPEEQLQALFGVAAEVQVQLMLKQVDLAVLRAQVGPEYPERAALEREVAALRKRAQEMDSGADLVPSGLRSGEAEGSLTVPLRDYPEASLSYLRAVREVRVQEAIYELLTDQYERYRIQESRDTPTVQVLDPAVPATLRAKPIRWLICVCATVAAFACSVLLAAFLESIRRMREESPERYERALRLARELRLASVLARI